MVVVYFAVWEKARMYGDCQVLPSMLGGGGGGGSGGGNVVSPDSLFSSQIRNPNLGGVAGFMTGVVPFSSFPPTVPVSKNALFFFFSSRETRKIL